MGFDKVSECANICAWSIHYFNERVKRDIEAWPVGIYAGFLRLLDLMERHGIDLRMPHSRAMGQGLFELRCKGREGIGRVFYCTLMDRHIVVLHSFIKKTQETPESELHIARNRQQKVRHAQH